MPASSDQLFIDAVQWHQAGRLSEAEHAYRRILIENPEHSDALHLLGVIALQTRNLEPALELIQKAVDLRPDGAVYRSNLGQVLEQMGRPKQAEQAYREAIAIDSACAEALNNLGRLCHSDDRLVEAENWGPVVVQEVDLNQKTYWYGLGDFQARIAREAPVREAESTNDE